MSEAPKGGAPEASTVRSSSLVLAARAILLVLAAGAAASAFFLTRHDGGAGLSSQGRYACPMHREVTAATPGECPICGMALKELAAGDPFLSPSGEALFRRQPGLVDLARQRIFTRDVRAPGWLDGEGVVQALLYDDEIATLTPGERGAFIPTATPGTRVDARLAERPPTRWDASTSRVDFEVEVASPGLRVGTAGWLELPARPRHLLVVPSTAVLQSKDGAYVLVASGDDRVFTRRRVEIGKTMFGLAVVVSGLREQERIVARTAFFLDAEARLGPGPEAAAAVSP